MYEIFSKLLHDRGVKAADVSRATGISQTVFSEWKKGKSTPKTDKLQKIADFFNVPLSFLMGWAQRGVIMTIGDRVKKLRTEKGMTQTELAEAIGTTKQNIYKYETGIISNIPMDRIKAIAKHLNVSPNYLMGWAQYSPQIEEQPKGTKKEGYIMFDNRLKLLREERNVSQASVAKDLGISRQTYNNYELGKREADSAMLITLADYFNCSIDYLLGHTDDPKLTAEDNSPKRLKAAVRKSHPKKPRAKKKKHDPTRRSRKAILERLKSYRPVKPEVRKEEKNMKEDMSKYIHDLSFALMSYSRNGVYRIRYICENDSEYAEISFTDGTKKRVNITGDSCLAATLDITKALI